MTTGLKLTPDVVAGIFLGDDQDLERPEDRQGEPRRQAARRTPITVAHRSDGSGTTAVFTDYLSKVSPGVEGEGRRGQERQVAGRPRRQGQRGRHRPGEDDAGHDRLRRARLRQAEPARPTRSCRTPPASSSSPRSTASARPPPASPKACPTTSASRSSTRPATRAIRSRRSPTSSSTQDTPDATKGKALAEFLWWAHPRRPEARPPISTTRRSRPRSWPRKRRS